MPPRTHAPPARDGQARLGDVYQEAYRPELPDWEDLESERPHFAQLKDPPTPRLLYALRLQAALVSAMKRFCDERGVPLLFFRPQLPSSFWEGEVAYRGRSYRLSGARADARLRELFTSAGVPLLEIDDLELAHTWLPRDAHLRPAGDRFVASRVGDWLLARRAVP